MIDFLRGSLVHRETDYVVLDVNGVGYRVFCANPYAVQAGEAEGITLFIHYHVREDAHLLFGFRSREEQTLFRRLLEVSGIGPKVALGIVGAGEPEAVVSAIYTEDVAFLTRLPGIGKKTAQRIVLDLKDKLSDLPVGQLAGPVGKSAAVPAAAPRGPWSEAKEALQALGYTEAEVERVKPAVQEAATGTEGADALVKLALQVLFRG
ncbi:Holliday junction branch migration protein RuvA [Paenibacillus aurantius]|uniref:Holliday junction branch migration complex subunit RuvA n=1 Tax=Paenibacillus aurantius TaxID=2918900 RepID=A0AA96LGV8_9BACL|nr:Holliday junction branch migration protein RuvA [Paenibacillus aurantius]WNQ12994.1 Holliday junction branch migration protein RuvA [Paenibacillus aurantius]